MNNTMSIFDIMYPKYKITKPIRLIEMFSGYGSQALALKYLGEPFEHWRTCEWAVKSIQAYKDIHFENNNIDYLALQPYDDKRKWLISWLFERGISSNYNESMTKEQISRLNDKQLKTIYNNIVATNNMVNIQQVKGKDLDIVDTDKYEYIMTYSFPCQDLSLAGKKKGMSDTSTRSGMLWEVERILTECQELGTMPQILLMENVPQVHSQDNMPDFHKWQVRLEELGYKSYWQDLIATDYGIPQTRNRCFMVSILGDYSYTFPQPIPLKLKLKDMLEDNVDEKYYLSDKMLKCLMNDDTKEFNRKERFLQTLQNTNEKGIASTLCTTGGSRPTDNFIKVKKETENYIEWEEKGKIQMNCRAWKDDKIVATLNTGGETKILIKNATKQGYLEATDGDGVDISSRMEYHRGNVQKDKIQTLTTSGGNDRGVVTACAMRGREGNQQIELSNRELANTITTVQKDSMVANNLRIRKLTPRECGRLMNVKDEDIDKIQLSDSAMYHIFGDSICTNVLMAIFGELLDINWKQKLEEMLYGNTN